MNLSHRHAVLALFGAGLLPFLLASPPAAAQGLPSDVPAQFVPVTAAFDYVRRSVMIPMRDGVKLHTVIIVPKGAARARRSCSRARRITPPRSRATPRAPTSAPPAGLRQRHRRHRRGRLHPRGAGRARQVRVGGRLRDEPPAARAAEPDRRRPCHRHVGHDRLAGEERPREQRQGRHPRDLLRRLPAADGAGGPAPGAQGRRADEPDGGRLDWRRLVPQRRVPPADDAVHVRPGRLRARATRQWWTSHFDQYDMYLQAGSAGELGRSRGLEQVGFWQQDARSSRLRRVLARPGGRQDPRGAAVERAGDAGARALGSGGHLRRHRRLQGDRAQGHRQRQGVPRDGPLVPRAADRGRQRARRPEVGQRHRAARSGGRSCVRSSISTSRMARRRRTSRP